jgi:lysophospholipase L1-like esterase
MRRRARRLQFETLELRQLLVGDPITGLGIAGDSLSDEYAVESYSYARNWDELLAEERAINLGPSGDFPEPRRMGYAYNWARAGGTSETLLADGQHTGLAAQIDAGLVSHAVLSIGPNDFFPEEDVPYFFIALGLWSSQQIQNYSDQVVANIETALAALYNTNVHLAMSNIADYGVAPLTGQFFNATQRDRVSTVVEAINARLEDLADQYNVPLVDINGIARFFFGSNSAPIDSWEIGGVEITNSAGIGPTNAFVHDAIHPHTLVQAQIANLYLTAFNLAYETPVDLFTEEESLALEGLTYGGSDTLNLDSSTFVKLWTNADPALSGAPASINYHAGAAPALIAPAATASDSDGLNFARGKLTAAITAGAQAGDKLAIRHQGMAAGQIGVNGDQVLFGGAAIGEFAGGDADAPLMISLNAQADVAAVQALLRNLTFQSEATAVAGARMINLSLSDGDGGVSNTATVTVNVTNDVPQPGWTNSPEPHDVDDNDVVNVQDLLSLLEFFRTHQIGSPLPPPGDSEPPPFADVTGDGQGDISDVLALVQFLRNLFSA